MSTSIASVKDNGRVISKVDIIADAYSRLRISGLTVNPTPEDLDLALTRLEDMMAEWETRNITVNYNFEDEPDPNSETGVISGYKNAMATNLAVDLIADFNKAVPPSLIAKASASLDSVSGRIALQRLQQVAYPRRQPVGSGNSLRWNRWSRFYRDYSGAPNVNNSNSMFIGDVNVYTEQYDAYLDTDNNEYIDSFDIQLDSGLELIDSELDDDCQDVIYKVKAVGSGSEFSSNSTVQVTIIITTNLGRVNTRRIFFTLERANATSAN